MPGIHFRPVLKTNFKIGLVGESVKTSLRPNGWMVERESESKSGGKERERAREREREREAESESETYFGINALAEADG